MSPKHVLRSESKRHSSVFIVRRCASDIIASRKLMTPVKIIILIEIVHKINKQNATQNIPELLKRIIYLRIRIISSCVRGCLKSKF